MKQAKPIKPEHLELAIRQANDFKRERDHARRQVKALLRMLEDIAYGQPKDARAIAQKAITKLDHLLEEPLYGQSKIKNQFARRMDHHPVSQ